jgi:transposase
MKPSYEQFETELAETTERLKLALEKIAELEEKLKLTSKNSSKPPSTEQKANTPPKPPKKRASRKGAARPKFPPERIDYTVECARENCPHCGSQSIESTAAPEALKQAELPEVRAVITEYLLHKYSCKDCGKRRYAWVASCSVAAFFKLHANRSRKAFEELVGKEANGLKAVTDRYSVYATIGKLHQYCLVHLIRDFRRYAEREGPDGRIGEALAHEFARACGVHTDYR